MCSSDLRTDAAEGNLTDLELTASRLDDRVIQAQKFLEDDEFLKSNEFKSFLYKVKESELVLQMKPDEHEERRMELVEKLQAYDPESEVMILQEARDLVERSGMLLIPRWDLEQAFMLDQIRRQENAFSYEAIGSDGFRRGTSFNIDTKSLAVWSMAPTSNKPS